MLLTIASIISGEPRYFNLRRVASRFKVVQRKIAAFQMEMQILGTKINVINFCLASGASILLSTAAMAVPMANLQKVAADSASPSSVVDVYYRCGAYGCYHRRAYYRGYYRPRHYRYGYRGGYFNPNGHLGLGGFGRTF